VPRCRNGSQEAEAAKCRDAGFGEHAGEPPTVPDIDCSSDHMLHEGRNIVGDHVWDQSAADARAPQVGA
jgi:hypothetical protein